MIRRDFFYLDVVYFTLTIQLSFIGNEICVIGLAGLIWHRFFCADRVDCYDKSGEYQSFKVFRKEFAEHYRHSHGKFPIIFAISADFSTLPDETSCSFITSAGVDIRKGKGGGSFRTERKCFGIRHLNFLSAKENLIFKSVKALKSERDQLIDEKNRLIPMKRRN